MEFFCGWESSNNNTIYVREYKFKQVIIELRSALSGLSSLNFSLFSPEKPTLKNFLIFFQKAFLFYRKRNFYWAFSELIFHESYIQNHSGIRELDGTRCIFTNVVYSGIFRTLSSTFQPQLSKRFYISGSGTFLYFRKWNFLALYFTYISGSNFPSSNNENQTTLKMFLILRKMELFS